jgi:hypothetical protein
LEKLLELRERFPHLAGDLRGALASMLLGLPDSVTAGMPAFALLGPGYPASGMVAGLASTVVAGIVGALGHGSASMRTARIISCFSIQPIQRPRQPTLQFRWLVSEFGAFSMSRS